MVKKKRTDPPVTRNCMKCNREIRIDFETESIKDFEQRTGWKAFQAHPFNSRPKYACPSCFTSMKEEEKDALEHPVYRPLTYEKKGQS